MNLENWIVERYLSDNLPISDSMLQRLINVYIDWYHRLEPVIGRPTSITPEPTDAIAARSRELMDMHYNMPLPMFESFLGRSMKYSMALWETGAADLDAAQEAMLADLCEKADIRDGQRILDIGCGFGSFAEHALRRYPNARVWGLTLSKTQADYMRAKQGESGHPLNTDRFYLIEDDFNEVTFEQPFDRIVSIGVFEHISNLTRALERIRSFLADRGKLFLHYIVYRPTPGGSDAPRQDPFMDKYVFPGGRIWAHTELSKHAHHFQIERNWFLSGRNYKRTIQHWLRAFEARADTVQREAGLTRRQARTWTLYLRACIATFNARGGRLYGNGQYLLHPN